MEEQLMAVEAVMKEKQNMLISETEKQVANIEKYISQILKQKKVQQEALAIKIKHE